MEVCLSTCALTLAPMNDIQSKAPYLTRHSMKQTVDKDLNETREWLEATLSVPNGVFAVTEREPSSPTARGKVIGTIGLRLMDAPPALFENSYVFTSSASPFLSSTPSTSSVSSGPGSSANSDESQGDGEKKAKPPQRWELGYQFRPDVWGKGYGTEAVKGILGAWARVRAALEDQTKTGGAPGNGEEGKGANADMVYAVTNRTNEPSRRVLVKAGFNIVGTFVDHVGTELVDHGVSPSSLS